jgi:hypothetical protein
MINPYYVMSKTMTFFHESFIHVDLCAREITNTIKYPDYINSLRASYDYRSDAQHCFVRYYDNASPLFPNAALRGLIEVNKKIGLKYTRSQLLNMLWSFGGTHL